MQLFGGTIAMRLGHLLGYGEADAAAPMTSADEQWMHDVRHGIDTTHLDRAHRYLASGIHTSFAGGDPAEMLELARHALALPMRHDYHDEAIILQDLIAAAEQLMVFEQRSREWRFGVEAALHALVALATPEIPVPVAGGGGVT
jgi:hypothetical protein